MSSITIALLQMTPRGGDEVANIDKGEDYCRRAGSMGADIALFPELWNIGYNDYDSTQADPIASWQAQAVSRDDHFVKYFQTLAQELGIAIALTYLERWSGAPRNTVSLIDRHGEIVMTYAKVHTCDFSDEAALTPGDGFRVCTLDTDKGDVRVGAMICYDREFPESARILMLRGAELILTPNASTLDDGRIGQFRSRAFENMVGVALTNYAAPKNNGRSIAFDAVSFDEIDGEPMETLIVEAGESEGIYLAEFDMEKIRAYRSRETWGNAYRKPGLYGLLTSRDVEEPFVRTDARR